MLRAPACRHRIVMDAHNARMESGYFWLGCGAVFAANDRVAPGATPTDQRIVDTLARRGIGWTYALDIDEVTPYPLDGEDASIQIAAMRELLAWPELWKILPSPVRVTGEILWQNKDVEAPIFSITHYYRRRLVRDRAALGKRTPEQCVCDKN